MAKVSFNQNPADEPIPVEESVASVQVVEAAPMAVAVPETEDVSGELSNRDLNMPRLSLVQSVGPMSELFKPGQIVLNKETVLTDGDKPIDITVTNIRKSFVENLPYNEDGPIPRRVDTLAEVQSLGGTIEYADDEPPTWIPVADALVMVGSTQDDPAFPFEHDGKFYAAAMWTLRKTSYTRAAKNIFTAKKLSLKGHPLCRGKWTLSTKREKIGQNFVFVPVLRQSGRNSDSFVNWIKELNLAG